MLSLGFAVRAYIGVLLVQIVLIIIATVISKCMGWDIKEQFSHRFGVSMEGMRA